MPNTPATSLFRSIPQVDELLNNPAIIALEETIIRPLIIESIRDTLADTRAAITQGTLTEVHKDALISTVCDRARSAQHLSLRRVINATGIIVHTNLGRSVLAESAVEAVLEAARGYSTLEYNVAAMQRGSRHVHCEALLCRLTGAEAAIAVNNNAAAVMMVLSEFAAEKEVVVSRGELVEIGGSFRVPDIMRQSHATMVEIGTTNKTHPFDYENAISENTGLLLKVHPSNYSLIGFTESVSIEQLRAIADRVNDERSPSCTAASPAKQGAVIVYEDQGSGALIDLGFLGAHSEPAVRTSVEQGCDLVSFSGDKLLGGPQAGIIVGSKHLIDRLKKNPLARALRLDKMSIAALEATLRLYLEPKKALRAIPTLAMLAAPAAEVERTANALKNLLAEAVSPEAVSLSVVAETARAGGGSLPSCEIDSFAVVLEFLKGSAQECNTFLITEYAVPIIARIKSDHLIFDARTLTQTDDLQAIAEAVSAYFASLGAGE